jgi:phosphoribosylformimino-5-aminoimidazole carboxamide ribotide isomerase
VTVYSDSPAEVAKSFEAAGAKNLHLVDLDGARDGTLANLQTIREVVSQTHLFIEVGGGIRDEARVKTYLDAGVGRVILGSVALRDPSFVERMVTRYGADKIAVGVDAREGMVAVDGWKTVSRTPAVDFCHEMQARGVRHIIYTDIAKDGAMGGTNLEVYRTLRAALPAMQWTASGGITYYDELRELDKLGIWGAILGKALYTGALDLREALKAVNEVED